MHVAETILTNDEINNTPDQAAIDLIRTGNTRAWEIIMRRYNQRLYRIARSILADNDAAEDAVQQTYISAYHKLDTYAYHGSFGAWLSRIAVNEALMIKRKPDNQIADTKDLLDEHNLTAANANPASIFANKELATLIENSIEKMPDDFRHVFMLRAIQQLSTKETADILAINEATVKTRYHRARGLMQNNLNKYIEQAGLHVYEFAGWRCDRIVNAVLKQLENFIVKK